MAAAVVLLGLVVLVMAYAALVGYRINLKPALVAFADWLDSLKINGWFFSLKPFAAIAGVIRTAVNAIEDGLEWLVRQFEPPVVWVWSQLSATIEGAAGEVAALAEQTADTFWRFANQTIPRYVAVALSPTVGLINGAVAAFRFTRDHVIPALTKTVGVLEKASLAQWDLWRRGIDRVSRETGKAITAEGQAWRSGVQTIYRTTRGQAGRLSNVEKLTVGAGAAFMVGTALRRLGLGWARCTNIGKYGRAVCRTDFDLLEDMILGTIAIVGTVSLVETAKDLQGITEGAVDFTRSLIREL